jgi:hypothetical protein
MPAGFTSPRGRQSSRFGLLVAGLNAADRLHGHMARTGMTLAGQKLWTATETAVLRRLYPDYRQACHVLRSRSRSAIGSKAFRLRITRPLRIWSDSDLRCLKTLYRQGQPMHVIRAMFPSKTAKQIWSRAAHSGWRRPRKLPKASSLKPYDDVRVRAFKLKLTMHDLACLSVTGSYFLRRPSRIDWRKIDKATAALDGRLSIAWKVP